MAAEGSYQVPPENDQTHSFSPRHSQLSSEGQTSSLRNWHHYWHAAVVVLGTGASIYLFHQGQVRVCAICRCFYTVRTRISDAEGELLSRLVLSGVSTSL